MELNDLTKEYLIKEGFQERTNEYGHTEWFKVEGNHGEFVYANYAMLFHFYKESYVDYLLMESIYLKLDRYCDKLNDVCML